MTESMAAINTDLPRIRAATAMETVDSGAIPVALIINARTSATRCKSMKKKMVGGSIARNSSLILVGTSLMAFSSSNAPFSPRPTLVEGIHQGGAVRELRYAYTASVMDAEYTDSHLDA